MLEWRPVALAGFVQLAASLALALVVFAARPDRPPNRWLAAFLLVGGLWHGSVEGVRMVFTDAADVHALGVVLYALLPWIAFTYLGFLGTMETPLVAPLRHPATRVALGLLATALSAIALARPSLWYEGLVPWRHVGGLQYDTAILADSFYPALLAMYLFGLVAALLAFLGARGPLLRRRMRWYLAAFATHDSIQLAWLYLLIFHINPKTAGPLIETTYFVLPALAALVLGTLLTYGILQAQLFDIDLKLKWTIRRGTLVGALVAAFFVAAAIAEQYLQQYGALVGGAAVGLLLFALRPLERAADRIANAAMPHVRDTDEYRTVRKREVYRAAVESALHDGVVTEKERDVLATLAQELGLGPADARAIERAAAAGVSLA